MDRCTLATRLATDSCWLFNELEYSMNECIESKKRRSCCHISLPVNDQSKDVRQSSHHHHHHHLHYIRKKAPLVNI